MDPVSLAAAAVVPFLVTYAQHLAGVAGKVVDEAVADRLRAIWSAVKKKSPTTARPRVPSPGSPGNPTTRDAKRPSKTTSTSRSSAIQPSALSSPNSSAGSSARR